MTLNNLVQAVGSPSSLKTHTWIRLVWRSKPEWSFCVAVGPDDPKETSALRSKDGGQVQDVRAGVEGRNICTRGSDGDGRWLQIDGYIFDQRKAMEARGSYCQRRELMRRTLWY
jgi:hypothetical protein